ncbi:MAG TPA: hypothetical protein VEW26_12375 [Allosphingosinicella sp.]|nr:hypothetical protein [Allosphingosinicella sp.]
MRRRTRRLALTFYGFMALAAALALIFALYAYRVRTSPFVADLQRRGALYPCIGAALFPNRPNEQTAFHIARNYLLDGGSRAPSLSWHFELEATGLAIRAAFRQAEVNRMYAALPVSKYRGFDDIALSVAGRRYCSLNERQKEAVREFSRSPRHERLRALLAASGAA